MRASEGQRAGRADLRDPCVWWSDAIGSRQLADPRGGGPERELSNGLTTSRIDQTKS